MSYEIEYNLKYFIWYETIKCIIYGLFIYGFDYMCGTGSSCLAVILFNKLQPHIMILQMMMHLYYFNAIFALRFLLVIFLLYNRYITTKLFNIIKE